MFYNIGTRSLGEGGDWLSLRKTLFLAPTMESMENPSFDLLETADEDWGDCRMEDLTSMLKKLFSFVAEAAAKWDTVFLDAKFFQVSLIFADNAAPTLWTGSLDYPQILG